MGKKKLTLEEQAAAILEKAQERGIASNYFFETTFARYQMQMEILGNLQEAIREHGPTVTKEYVKGRQNVVTNPAITEYNKTSTAANGTVQTLIKIVDSLTETGGQGSKLKALADSLE